MKKRTLLFMLPLIAMSVAGCTKTDPTPSPEPTPVVVTLQGIVVSNAKTAYIVGETFSTEGMKVVARYSDGSNKEVTGYTVDKTAPLTLEDTKVTVSYTENGVTKVAYVTISVTEQKVSSLQVAWEKANALADKEHTEEKLEFEGVVTGLQSDSFFVQDGDYAIYMYRAATAEIAIGKKVSIKAHLQNYGGMVESWSDTNVESTKVEIVSVEDGTPVVAEKLESKAELDETNVNNLVEAADLAVVSIDQAWVQNSKEGKYSVKFDGEEETFVLSISRYIINQTAVDVMTSVAVGSKITVDSGVVDIYKTVKQLSILNSTVISVKKVGVVEITSVVAPEEVEQNSTLDVKAVNVGVKFEDDSTGTVNPDSIDLDTSNLGPATGTVHVGTLTATFETTIITAVNPVHAGTVEDPFTSADACLVASKLVIGTTTTESYYIKDVVESFEEEFNPSYGNYSFKLVDGFVGWRLKNGPSLAKFAAGDIELGDTVTMYTKIQSYAPDGTPESSGGYITEVVKPGQAVVDGIESVKSSPATVEKDGVINPADVVLVLHYSDSTTQEGVAQEVVCDTSSVGKKTATAKYGTFTKDFEIEVIEEVNPQHAGTAEDPYTGADAVIVANKLAAGEVTTDFFYIKGKVISFEETFSPSYGNYSFKIEGGFIGWRLKNGSSGAKFAEGDMEIDDVVTMYAKIQKFPTGALETKDGYVVTIEKAPKATLDSIEITTDPTKVEYTEGESFDPTGMVVTANYTLEKASAPVTGYTWAPNGALATTDNKVTISYTEGGVTKTAEVAITVNASAQPVLSSIEVTTQPTKTVYNAGETFDPTGMVVTANYTLEKPSAPVTGYTYSTDPLTTGTTSITISYTEDEVTQTTTVAITVNMVNQIEAAYKAAEALDHNVESADKYEFKGVVVAKRGSEYYVQSEGYGIDVYGQRDGFAVGKEVAVKSTVKNYNGTLETATIESSSVLGDGTMPDALDITSSTVLSNAKLNVLAKVTGYAKADVTVNTEKDLNLILSVGGTDVTVYVKKSMLSNLKTQLETIKAGAEVVVSNAVTGTYKTNRQVVFCDDSTFSITNTTVKTVTVTKSPESIEQGGTLKLTDVTVSLEYNNGFTVSTNPTSIDLDTSVVGDAVVGKAYVGDVYGEFNIKVTSSETKVLDCNFADKTSGNNQYTGTWDYGTEFTVTNGANNNKSWEYLKMGKKSTADAQNCTVINKNALTAAVSKVKISLLAQKLATGMTVNEAGVKYYNASKEVTDNVTFTSSVDGTEKTITVTPSTGKTWSAGGYIEVYFNVTNTSSTQGVVFLSRIVFVA